MVIRKGGVAGERGKGSRAWPPGKQPTPQLQLWRTDLGGQHVLLHQLLNLAPQRRLPHRLEPRDAARRLALG